jgi:hypothetical protein
MSNRRMTGAEMRKAIVFVTILVASPASAQNVMPLPNFDSEKTCREAFGPTGTRPNGHLLKTCLESEQKNYNLSRIAWEYLSQASAQLCNDHVKQAMARAQATRKFNYPGLVDPYTELWLCVSKRMKVDEAQRPPKQFQKW